MTMNRIQKLLFSEYCDFDDMVLIESPFAETTRDGKGVRQVQIGLTPNKLIMATDVIPSAESSKPWCLHNIDPEIETFELISIYPIDCVNLSIFRRKKRQSIKAHFCNKRIIYYELGGFEKKKMFWNLWCERVKFLSPNDVNSSRSETSVGSSSSNSTLYLINVKTKFPQNKLPQLWCTFGGGDGCNLKKKWNEKNLYLGNRWEGLSSRLFQPLPGHSLTNMKKIDDKHQKLSIIEESSAIANISKNDKNLNNKVLNISKNVVTPDKNIMKEKKIISKAIFRHHVMKIVDHAVSQWENSLKNNNHIEIRHRRRYAFNPQPHFYYGLGPWNVRTGERDSIQVKCVVSEVKIHRQPGDSELRLPVSKRQLSASISVDALLNKPRMINTIVVNSSCWNNYPSAPIKIFWTPEYWYRPRSPCDLYQELQLHLRKIRIQHQKINPKMLTSMCFFQYKKRNKNSMESLLNLSKGYFKSKKLLYYKSKQDYKKHIGEGTFPLSDKHRSETSLEYMQRKLKINSMLSIWDFDSTTIAYQLTIIDRDLFLKIKEIELGILVWQKSCKNAPNISAIIAFSHRICCLVTTEIIKQDVEKLRSRVICRFISIADNCNRICNFQSCKSVLCGLQSLPVYRLKLTWSYIRRKHFSKYQLFKNLCRLYRDPRLPIYQREFSHAKQNYPYLPYIGDILFQLMGKIPKPCSKHYHTELDKNHNFIPLLDEDIRLLRNRNKIESSPTLPNIFQRFVSVFKISEKSNDSNSQYITTLESLKQSKYNPRSKINHSNICSKHTQKNRNFVYNGCKSKVYFEDNRNLRLNEVTELLKIFQKSVAKYVLCKNDSANDYLLKSRYKEDKENFFLSFNIEAKRT